MRRTSRTHLGRKVAAGRRAGRAVYVIGMDMSPPVRAADTAAAPRLAGDTARMNDKDGIPKHRLAGTGGGSGGGGGGGGTWSPGRRPPTGPSRPAGARTSRPPRRWPPRRGTGIGTCPLTRRDAGPSQYGHCATPARPAKPPGPGPELQGNPHSPSFAPPSLRAPHFEGMNSMGGAPQRRGGGGLGVGWRGL